MPNRRWTITTCVLAAICIVLACVAYIVWNPEPPAAPQAPPEPPPSPLARLIVLAEGIAVDIERGDHEAYGRHRRDYELELSRVDRPHLPREMGRAVAMLELEFLGIRISDFD